MRKISALEMRTIQLQILSFLDKVCCDYNLNYMAVGGTLLGTIRHNGYIPWDDDIDVCMPRPDFEKLKNILRENKISDRYVLFSPETEKYYYSFGKLFDKHTCLIEGNVDKKIEGMGIDIDIFPLDAVPANMRKARKQFKRCHRLSVLMFSYSSLNSLPKFSGSINIYLKSWMLLFSKLFWGIFGGLEKIKKVHNNRVLKYDYNNEKYVFPTGGRYGIKEIYEKSIFQKYEMHKFEDRLIRVPVGYEQYLTQLYGDYMTLPPVEKRVTDHNFTAYWKESGNKDI